MERRSCWSLILCLLVILIMGFLGYIHFKRELINKLTNEVEFSEAAVRQTELGIKNYDFAVEHIQTKMNNVEKEVKELQDEVGKLDSAKQQKDTEVKACTDSVTELNSAIAAVEKDKSDIDANFAGEKTNWTGVIDGFKKQLQEKSPVCAHVLMEQFDKEPTLKDLCPIQPASQA